MYLFVEAKGISQWQSMMPRRSADNCQNGPLPGLIPVPRMAQLTIVPKN